VKVGLARPEHEPALRAIIAAQEMPGWIRMAYGREPDFFHGLGVEGPFQQAMVYLDPDGGVQGMATRAVKPAWISGEPGALGYLGGLRLQPGVRGGMGLFRGYRLLRELHGDGRCAFYLTTITDDNHEAQRVLTSGRAGLPHYMPAGGLHIQVVSTRWLARKLAPDPGLEVVGAERVGAERLFAFYEGYGPRRQLFPRLAHEDLGTPYLRGLALEDFLVVLGSDGEILGAAALWDQAAFKQTHITGYAPGLRALVPFARPLVRWRTGLRLPRAGERLPLVYLAFPCLAQDHPAVLRALLAAAGARLDARGEPCLLLGFHEDDPLSPGDLQAVSYRSRVYLAHWDDGAAACRAIIADGRPLHLEAASL
jgi:hypothetical protein